MALDNYTDLQASVASWMRRSDLAAQIPDFIALAEAVMNRHLRTSLQLVTATMAIGAEFVDKPAGFRMMRSLRLTSGTGRKLVPIAPEQMAARKALPTVLSSAPQEFTAVGSQFEFYPVPDQAYSAEIQYQAVIPPLSAGNPTNWLLTDHPDCYLFGALAAGLAFVKSDQRAGEFQAQFEKSLDEVEAALRTNYDRTLRVEPGLQRRSAFNILTGDTV